MKVRNPYNGDYDYEFSPTTAQEMADACDRLREKQPQWQDLGVDGRADVLRRFGEVVAAHRDRLIDSLVQDTGRHAISVSEATIEPKIEREIAFAKKVLIEETQEQTELPDVVNRRQLSPYGLVGNITPWNFPCSMALLDTLPALLAGCAVIVKPSEVTPRFIDVIEDFVGKVPELSAVLSFVRGDGALGAELIRHVDYICFTGSVKTGRQVYQAAAEQFIPASLELGGKDPLIVLEDADPEKAAVSAVIGSCVASGQLCTALERIYVAKPIYADFVDAAISYANRVDINYPDIQSGFIGPFILERQADIVRHHIQDAAEKGAEIKSGGEIIDHGGRWCLPTVMTNVDHTMKVMKEESFGPLIPIMTFDSIEEAIALANDSDYGLTASVYGGNTAAGERVARELHAGGVSVNRAGITLMVRGFEQDAWNASGTGKNRMGPEGIRRFLRSKAIMSYEGQDSELASPLIDQVFTKSA